MPSEGPTQEARPGASPGRLDSWGEIAAYLRRSVRAVQRWEKEAGLPVHRLPHAKRDTVWALRSELDAWNAQRESSRGEPVAVAERVEGPPEAALEARQSPRGSWRTHVVALAGVGLVASLAALLVSARSLTAPAPVKSLPSLRPLAAEPEHEGTPSLSPDGEEVVYYWWKGNPGLFVKPTSGGPARRLTDPGMNRVDAYAKWSPTGDTIAFLRQEGQEPEKRGLYLIAPDGGGLRRLTEISGIGLCWTADGEALAFVDRTSPYEPYSIHQITIADGRQRPLTNPPTGLFGDLQCSFSPDGQNMAFTRWRSIQEADIWLLPTGGEPRPVTFGGDAHEGLDWTPDSQAIVFASRRRARLSLWKVQVDGAGREPPTLIEGTETGAMLPAFSRPGAGRPAKLAFENRMQAVGIWRWERRRAGSPASGRVVSSVWSDDHPSLSPDGRRMAFTSNRGGTSELWLANSDGTGLKQLSDYGGPKPVASRWSPDGRSLVFAAEDGGNHDIFVMDHEGAASRRVVGGPSEEGNPSWSMDGNWIYFRSDRGGSVRIWRVPSTGGQAIVVTAAPGSQAFESSDGRLLYYTKGTNTRGVWAVPVEGGSEVEVLPGVREGYWAVSDRGILFLAPESPDLYANQAIMLFSPATRTISRVAAIPADGGQTLPGFAASRDGRSVLWSQVDSQVSDIVLLDPWGN